MGERKGGGDAGQLILAQRGTVLMLMILLHRKTSTGFRGAEANNNLSAAA